VYIGDATCDTFDELRPPWKLGGDGSPPFPLCSLRSIQPPIESSPEGERRFQHPLAASPEYKIQCNRTASRALANYIIEWSWLDDINPESSEAEQLELDGRGRATGTGEFVRNLKLGDVVTIWGKARFGGWVNHVKEVSIKIYWAL
jgi:hypothetical protein